MDLTDIIKTDYPSHIVDKMYEDNNVQRTRLGLSQIGEPCKRYLWYCHHGYKQEPCSGRVLRLFELGNILEDQMKKDMTAAGFNIDSDQEEVKFEYNGLELIGHIDGKIHNLRQSKKTHLLELKTCSEKYFNQLIKAQSYEAWNPKYKAQIHAYMLGLGLDRAYVQVYCKNTSALYDERIPLDKDYIVRLLQDVFDAIGQTLPPERMCPKSDYFKARFCNFRGECWGC